MTIAALSLAISASYAKPGAAEMTIIRIGAGRERIGVDTASGDAMRPLFFGLDRNGAFHVPDFKNNRVAVFAKDGTFLREVRGTTGISPRMNYFDVTPDGSYVVFNDGGLSLSNDDGTTRWQAPFPIGVIPSHIIATDKAIFAAVDTDGTTRSVSIPVQPPYAAEDSATGVIAGERRVPFRIAHDTDDADIASAIGPERLPVDLLSAFADGSTIWKSGSGRDTAVIAIAADGALMAVVPLEEAYATEGEWRTIRAAQHNGGIVVACMTVTDDALILYSWFLRIA